MLNHVLLELFCLKGSDENVNENRPQYCKSTDNNPSYSCLKNDCPYLAYTTCENTLCYINELSEMEDGILFGGEMVKDKSFENSLNRWKEISLKTIQDAYKKYMDSDPV